MIRAHLVGAGLLAAAMLATPAMAEQAIQEPGPMAQNYPFSDYLTGGWGVRASPGPGYYYRRDYGPPRYYGPPAILGGPVGPAGAVVVVPLGSPGPYAYY